MTKILLIVTLMIMVCVGPMSLAMHVAQYTMPSAEVLQHRLHGFTTDLENTNLIGDLANQRLIDCSVIWTLELAFYDRLEFLRRKGYNTTELLLYREKLEKQRPFLLSLLLQDFPDVLTIIRKTGYYKPMIFY